MKKMLLLVIMIGHLVPAFALRIVFGSNILISQPVYEDLYIAGGNITINAPVYGDLIIAGGTIIINDTVTNDILLAGGTVTFNGFTGDDIRCAGGNIHITKPVAGDVVVTGGRVTIDKAVTIGGLLASGGDITIDGNINGEVRGAFGDLFLNGKISGNVECRGGSITVNGIIEGRSVLSARHILIGNNAVFNNDVRYWSEQSSLDFKPYLKSGKAIYDPSLRIPSAKWYYLGGTTFFALLWYLGMALLMILIAQYLFSATVKKAADTVFNHTLKALGSGLLFIIAVPIAAVIAFVTVIGVPVGLLLLFSYIALILLATVITSVVAANWINNRFNKEWNYWRLAFAVFGVFILLKLVFLAPFAGGVITIFLFCISFGSILLNIRWRTKETLVASAG